MLEKHKLQHILELNRILFVDVKSLILFRFIVNCVRKPQIILRLIARIKKLKKLDMKLKENKSQTTRYNPLA